MSEGHEEKLDKLSVFIAENFGILKTEITGIREEFKRLNGNVARHEAKLNDHESKIVVIRADLDNTRKPWHMPGWVTLLSSGFVGLAVYFLTRFSEKM